MDIDLQTINDLVANPSESLSIELKRWISPDEPDGIAKIIKAVLAFRNHNGGALVIGFDDESRQPDTVNTPTGDIRTIFNIDKIQRLVSRYASELFEVLVVFGERDDRLYPVIVVPSGVKTPVASKSDLFSEGRKLVAENTIYIRSLEANHTPSTTRASWKDWSNIIDICFDNREADIGRFLRRHLVGLTPESLQELRSSLAEIVQPEITDATLLDRLLQEGEQRFQEQFQEMINENALTPPPHGTWEVGLIIIGEVPAHFTNSEFLNLLHASNPRHTGWPVWLDSRTFTNQSSHPYVYNDAWEALIYSVDSNRISNHIDFMRIDPRGRFYLKRALLDDLVSISSNEHEIEPLSVLDFTLPVTRTTEAISVGIAFSRAMGCDIENCQLAFAFRWSGLQGRELNSWVDRERYITPGRVARQDSVTGYVTVPLDAPLSTLGQYVNQAVSPLYSVFNGWTLSQDTRENLVARVIERQF